MGLAAYMAHNRADVSRENGINPWSVLQRHDVIRANCRRWLGVFNGASAFNNSGMSLLDANMVFSDYLKMPERY